MEQLPPPLLGHILSFVSKPLSGCALHLDAFDGDDNLQHVSQVSTAWREWASAFRLQWLTVGNVDDICDLTTERGALARALTIHQEAFEVAANVLQACPNIEFLRLVEGEESEDGEEEEDEGGGEEEGKELEANEKEDDESPKSALFGAVISAAASFCPRVKVLDLPDSWSYLERDLDSLEDALLRWSQREELGLWRIIAPSSVDHDSHGTSDDERVGQLSSDKYQQAVGRYFGIVARFCPQLRKLSRDDEMLLSCLPRDQQLELWSQLLQNCRALKKLAWVKFPINDQYVDVLSNHPKMELRSLDLRRNREWKLRGFTLNQWRRILGACPRLKKLRLDAFVSEDAENDSARSTEVDGGDIGSADPVDMFYKVVVPILPVSLRCLSITSTRFIGEHTMALAQMSSLRIVELCGVRRRRRRDRWAEPWSTGVRGGESTLMAFDLVELLRGARCVRLSSIVNNTDSSSTFELIDALLDLLLELPTLPAKRFCLTWHHRERALLPADMERREFAIATLMERFKGLTAECFGRGSVHLRYNTGSCGKT